MFAVVLQQEHEKLAEKTPKKANKTIIMDESSNSDNKDMSVDHMPISKTDKADSPSKKLMDESRTYQCRIEKLGAITNDK
jgi:hypothetical protein